MHAVPDVGGGEALPCSRPPPTRKAPSGPYVGTRASRVQPYPTLLPTSYLYERGLYEVHSLTMATKFNSHVLRGCNRLTAVTRIPRRTFFSRTSPFRNIRTPVLYFCLPAPRNFQTTSSYHAGIMPETDKPAPREAQDNEPVLRPAEQTEEEFHQRSEDFLQNLVERLEQLQDKNSALEVEYSV